MTLGSLQQWITPLAFGLGGLALGLGIMALVYGLLGRRLQEGGTGARILELTRGPARLTVVLMGLNLGLVLQPLPLPEIQAVVLHGLRLAWITAAAWWVIQATLALEALLTLRYDMSKPDNLRARKVLTQYKVIQRILVVVVAVLALAGMLMTFDSLRGVGAGILASAGLASVVVGFAAQKTLSNILASIQIAFTQPFRIDDVVIVQGEWGRIEEIRFTYVVVRIWDERRLVVPVSWFIENPFQNWTQKSAQLTGSVLVQADYTVDVDRVRRAVTTVLEGEGPGTGKEMWDGRVNAVQVTEAGERTVQLRVLVSAANASQLWDLRCLVREKVIAHLRDDQPEALPRGREEWLGENTPD